MSSTASVPEAGHADNERARRLTENIFRVRELGIVLALLLLIGITAAIEPRFIHLGSLQDLTRNGSIYAVMAAGETLVLVTRNVDLSVGSVLGLSAYMTGDLLSHGSPIILAFVLAILLGGAAGLVNGLLVTFGRVPALVVTLGTLYAFRGLAFLWTGGNQIDADQMPTSFLKIGTGTILDVPTITVIALVLVIIVGLCLRNFRAGRELYAIGSNGEAARLAGIRSDRRVVSAFVVSGMCAGLAGVLFAARFGTVDATGGTGYELTVVSAAVVGGVAITGGIGSVYGAALGALLLGCITSALIVLRIDSFWQQAAVGALLIVAIAFDRFIGLRLDAALRQRSAARA